MIVRKYQLAKYSEPTGRGGYKSVSIIGSFNSYISALLYKIVTFRFKYRLESFEFNDEIFM